MELMKLRELAAAFRESCGVFSVDCALRRAFTGSDDCSGEFCSDCRRSMREKAARVIEDAADKLDAVERECNLLEMGSEHDRNIAGRFRRAIGREPDTVESILAEMTRIIESCNGEDLLPLVERYKRLKGVE